MKAKATWFTMAVGTVLIAAGCGGTKTIGTPAGADTVETPLAAVLDAPEKYDGQTVVLKGVLEAQCAALCDFTYAEGNRSVTVFTGEPKPPKIQAGQPVRVTVQVHKGEEQVVLTAKGLEILPRKATR
ncbi:MAG: hypothetical protein FJ224_02540 [Lentisphaerae bacterium]|nr:hypothetical protein [Lentisphaerota bacterium]